MTMRARLSAVALSGAALVALSGAALLAACAAPRDPGLEAKVEAARARAQSGAVAAKPRAAPAAPARSPRSAFGASKKRAVAAPRGVDRVTYGDSEIASILGKVEGAGADLKVAFETEAGTIRCTLAPDAAPQTVANFVALATAQRPWRDPDTRELMSTPFYDGLTFHRAVSNFIIQTGNPAATGTGGPGWTVPREAGVADAFAQAGVLAMVDAGDDTHGSQLFITLRADKNLAKKYTAFGKCEDLDVVRTISSGEKLPPRPGQKSAVTPKDPVTLKKVRVFRG